MRAVLQRVSEATVTVDGKVTGQIGQGLLVLVGIAKTDSEAIAQKLINRLLDYRVFADSCDRMNLSLRDIEGGLLLVSQFTLQAETSKGRRPGFSQAAAPALASQLYNYCVTYAKGQYMSERVQQGEFGANMQVQLCNDGPVTFILDLD